MPQRVPRGPAADRFAPRKRPPEGRPPPPRPDVLQPEEPPQQGWLHRNRIFVALFAVGLLAAGYAIHLVSGIGSGTPQATDDANQAALAPGDPSTGGPPSSAGASASVGPSVTASAVGAAKPPGQPQKPVVPPAQSGYPGASNTGVPTGMSLGAYSGPCTITAANTVIDAKTVSCKLLIRGKGVVIKRSKVNSPIDTSEGGSLTISDAVSR